ncbi:hypothetical protein BASA50_004246 [Batrachochytrium salamandrivorans]|uniref:C2H2-type domain-containing protein n=1 Tax=Batrachochytrium salamandrivorans TaxID=1357716 RepID=A0ABQ8FFU8_9FUNG|nr:hypothetical protein BASA62_007436 [Batrachochytrium salamandrivorans]KAH6579180.1 hypothetical protein BASA60_003364 [Batrachochytrium salamandrivorans]KAH6597639.1 hypothetical protein BASA50_004246 [Batrachochytrium salamandrivorans]KAH6602156.1 hypothetical protein BASA61_001402 [Batrachochytrium salamandrivorans]KAH9254689.1 hypothetical protein BASA81_007239 [Batrachochytrium salamandrivorans]
MLKSASDIKLTPSSSVTELRQFWEVMSKQKNQQNPQNFDNRSHCHVSSDTHALSRDQENIVFALKTIVVNNTKVTEIEFCCTTCRSAFVLRAAHECISEHTPSHLDSQEKQQGLEWYRNQKCDHINMII